MTALWPYLVAALVALAFWLIRQSARKLHESDLRFAAALRHSASRPPDARTAAPEAGEATPQPGETRNAASAALRGEDAP